MVGDPGVSGVTGQHGRPWVVVGILALFFAVVQLCWAGYSAFDRFGIADYLKVIFYNDRHKGLGDADVGALSSAVFFGVFGALALRRSQLARGVLVGLSLFIGYNALRSLTGGLFDSTQKGYFTGQLEGQLKLATFGLGVVVSAAIVILMVWVVRSRNALAPAASGTGAASGLPFGQGPQQGGEAPQFQHLQQQSFQQQGQQASVSQQLAAPATTVAEYQQSEFQQQPQPTAFQPSQPTVPQPAVQQPAFQPEQPWGPPVGPPAQSAAPTGPPVDPRSAFAQPAAEPAVVVEEPQVGLGKGQPAAAEPAAAVAPAAPSAPPAPAAGAGETGSTFTFARNTLQASDLAQTGEPVEDAPQDSAGPERSGPTPPEIRELLKPFSQRTARISRQANAPEQDRQEPADAPSDRVPSDRVPSDRVPSDRPPAQQDAQQDAQLDAEPQDSPREEPTAQLRKVEIDSKRDSSGESPADGKGPSGNSGTE